MSHSIKTKIIAGFLGIFLLSALTCTVIGSRLCYKSLHRETARRLKSELDKAVLLFQNKAGEIENALALTILKENLSSTLEDKDFPRLGRLLTIMDQDPDIDFAGISDGRGKVILRTGTVDFKLPGVAIGMKRPLSGLIAVSTPLTEKKTPGGNILEKRFDGTRDKELLAIAAAIPLFSGKEVIGAVYAGLILNKNLTFVDYLEKSLYSKHRTGTEGAEIISIFFRDACIATNIDPQMQAGINNRILKEIRKTFLLKEQNGPAPPLVNERGYIGKFVSINDIFDKRIGIVGLSIPEPHYFDMMAKGDLFLLVIIILFCIILVTGLGYFMAQKILNPVRSLIKTTRQLKEGNLTPDIGSVSKDELGLLQKNFSEIIGTMERKIAESNNALFQTEKQASIGRLAAGIAHEVNNPLTGVLTFSHMLLKRKDLAEDVRSDLQIIADSTERVRKIVKGLLDFSRQTMLDKEPTDLNSLLALTIPLIKNQAFVKGIDVKFCPEAGIPLITLDRSQFQSAILNILINALDATESGGEIRVTTGLCHLDSTGRDEAEIIVTDTGCGIPPENIGRLFDPFFTTKAVGHGTGLGLSVSYGIAERHGGKIMVESIVGKGSTFIITVPIDDKKQ